MLYVDDDIQRFLLRQMRTFEDDPSTLLRRMLGIGQESSRTRRGKPVGAPRISHGGRGPWPHELTASLRKAPWLPFDLQRYLYLLGAIAAVRPKRFPEILQIRGRSRIYFSRDPAEIEASGVATHPRPIAGTSYWALTHHPRREMERILRNAMTLFDFTEIAMLDAREFLVRVHIPVLPDGR